MDTNVPKVEGDVSPMDSGSDTAIVATSSDLESTKSNSDGIAKDDDDTKNREGPNTNHPSSTPTDTVDTMDVDSSGSNKEGSNDSIEAMQIDIKTDDNSKTDESNQKGEEKDDVNESRGTKRRSRRSSRVTPPRTSKRKKTDTKSNVTRSTRSRPSTRSTKKESSEEVSSESSKDDEIDEPPPKTSRSARGDRRNARRKRDEAAEENKIAKSDDTLKKDSETTKLDKKETVKDSKDKSVSSNDTSNSNKDKNQSSAVSSTVSEGSDTDKVNTEVKSEVPVQQSTEICAVSVAPVVPIRASSRGGGHRRADKGKKTKSSSKKKEKRKPCRFTLCNCCYQSYKEKPDKDKFPFGKPEVVPLVELKCETVYPNTEDPDEMMESEFLGTRQAFLTLCQGNHYQFDQLRRAKHSTMMVLYHLHNPTAPAFVHTCNDCQTDIMSGFRYHCNVCSDYDVQRAIRLHMKLLVHASGCRINDCGSSNCTKMKSLLKHGASCKVRATGGCNICRRIWALLQIH
eukprot:GSMAST32.ASY1.ANO1.353.1 assembled CDS